ncbi:hypothetical protein DV515_00015175, partial [Chloebia gouldiae]
IESKDVQMMKFAWDNYKQYALGKNELRPLTKNGHIGNMFVLATEESFFDLYPEPICSEISDSK